MILIPKYFFEVQDHVVGSGHGLMLMLQHIGYRGQYVAANHLVSLTPFFIGLVFLFRGDVIWLKWAYLSQYKFIAFGSQDMVQVTLPINIVWTSKFVHFEND